MQGRNFTNFFGGAKKNFRSERGISFFLLALCTNISLKYWQGYSPFSLLVNYAPEYMYILYVLKHRWIINELEQCFVLRFKNKKCVNTRCFPNDSAKKSIFSRSSCKTIAAAAAMTQCTITPILLSLKYAVGPRFINPQDFSTFAIAAFANIGT